MRLRTLNPFRDSAGRPRSPLRREIALMLALKLLLLFGIWKAFFSQPVLPKMTEGMDPDRVAAVLIAPAAAGAIPSAPGFTAPGPGYSPNPTAPERQP